MDKTYNTEGPNQDAGRDVVCGDHFRDEVCGHADYGDETHGLHASDDGKRHTESSVGWCRHFEVANVVWL